MPVKMVTSVFFGTGNLRGGKCKKTAIGSDFLDNQIIHLKFFQNHLLEFFNERSKPQFHNCRFFDKDLFDFILCIGSLISRKCQRGKLVTVFHGVLILSKSTGWNQGLTGQTFIFEYLCTILSAASLLLLCT